MPQSLSKLAILVLFLFPIASNLIEHSTSAISILLTLMGIYIWLSGRHDLLLDRDEKRIMWAFAVYFGVCFVFYLAWGLLSENHSLKWRLDHESRMLTFIPIYILCARLHIKPWVLWWGAAIAAIAYGIYSLIFLYGISPDQRVTGAYHPIAFGTVALITGFFSLSGMKYFQRLGTWWTVVPVIAVTCGMLAGFLSGTRATLIVIPFLTIVFFIQLNTFSRPWLFRTLLILIITVMAAASYHFPGSTMRHRIHTGIHDAGMMLEGKEVAGSHAIHLRLWAEGWKIFTDHPFAGVGARGYDAIIKEKVEKNLVPAQLAQLPSPHNMYLNNMTAYGITGLFILLGIFLTPLIILAPAAKKDGPAQDVAYAGIMLITALMLFAMTESIFIRNININIYVILLAMIVSMVKHHQDDPRPSS
ncbi:MAG: O-antigen ligase family protein [Desulfobacteraceae bacterium]|jgi:O-antigen ligase|nr:MAG: O-antigen ligase family protein [Desulfobacteraceae bacterium]